MVEAVQNYIGSLNWGYRLSLREKSVTYQNAYGEFVEPHKIKVCVMFKSLYLVERENLGSWAAI